MKIRAIISLLFISIITILYTFGICEWDIIVYILSVAITILFMLVFMRQEKKYNELSFKQKNLDIELRKHISE